MSYPKVYKMLRNQDVSGINGTGLVGWATEYPNGMTTVCWEGDIKSVVMYQSLDEAIKIHGHGGATLFIQCFV